MLRARISFVVSPSRGSASEMFGEIIARNHPSKTQIARTRVVEADRRAHGRRLYLAGDHCVAPTLEGAVVSGLRAARAVRADLDQEVSLLAPHGIRLTVREVEEEPAASTR